MPSGVESSIESSVEPGVEPSRRLFIGLLPDQAVRAAVVEHRKAWYWPHGSRLTLPQRLHLTLHFLGEVQASQQTVLQRAMAETPMDRLSLVLRTPQTWRNGVAVLLPDEHEGLRDLRDRLVPRLQCAGLMPSRAQWTPHITLARQATEAGPPDLLRSIAWTVKDVVLVWSRLSPIVRYEVLGRYPARPAPGR